MPRPKRKTVTRRTGFTETQIHHVLTCHDFFGEGLGQDCPLETLAEAWQVLRATELPKWIQRRPGTRPRIWWHCDAPEKRRDAETERDYLRRLYLLQPAENAAVERMDMD